MLYANYNLAGTDKFRSHVVTDDEARTLCGLRIDSLRGDWQETGDRDDAVSCAKCKRKARLSNSQVVRISEGKNAI